MSAFLSQSKIIGKPIEDGDCGVILRKDEGFPIFSTGAIDPNSMLERQEEQGTLLAAIAMCLNIPKLKENMIRKVSDLHFSEQINLDNIVY